MGINIGPAPDPEYFHAVVGDGKGNVHVPGFSRYVFIRMDDGRVATAFSGMYNLIDNQPVLVDLDLSGMGSFRVIEVGLGTTPGVPVPTAPTAKIVCRYCGQTVPAGEPCPKCGAPPAQAVTEEKQTIPSHKSGNLISISQWYDIGDLTIRWTFQFDDGPQEVVLNFNQLEHQQSAMLMRAYNGDPMPLAVYWADKLNRPVPEVKGWAKHFPMLFHKMQTIRVTV